MIRQTHSDQTIGAPISRSTVRRRLSCSGLKGQVAFSKPPDLRKVGFTRVSRTMSPNTFQSFDRTTWRQKKNKVSWLSWTFLPLSIYGGTWKLRKPIIQWYLKKLCGAVSNHAGIRWVNRFSHKLVSSPCQLKRMPSIKQKGDIANTKTIWNSWDFFSKIQLSDSLKLFC